MKTGVYYMPFADQVVIAWELYQKNEVALHNTNLNLSEASYGFGVVLYQLCAIAVEGPNGAMMYNVDQFEKYFVYIGELEKCDKGE